jgi:RNA polymerase sigma-70 factor (ECF subfamily)
MYRDNMDRVYRFMYWRVGNRPGAEDLTSEVFRAAFRPLKLASSNGEVRSHPLATAQTVFASHWRHILAGPSTPIDPESDMNVLIEPSGLKEPRDARRRARGFMVALPDPRRRILELRFLETSSFKETPQAMGVDGTNAEVQQHRALRMAADIAWKVEQ